MQAPARARSACKVRVAGRPLVAARLCARLAGTSMSKSEPDVSKTAALVAAALICGGWLLLRGTAVPAGQHVPVLCGNGSIEQPEQCDDGDPAFTPGDYCDDRCRLLPCGKPTHSSGPAPTASDALFSLRAAVGLASCDLRVCDANHSTALTATDGLLLLKAAVGQRVGLDCGPDAAGPLATIHRIGRFDDQGRFVWPGSAIVTRVEGTEVSIRLDDSGGNQFEVLIDGEAQPVLRTTAGDNTYLLASALSAGEHDVVVTRRTEPMFGVTRFRGFPGATLIDTYGRGRLIEVVGDSITCGYGILGDSPTCPFSADTEAETRAWAALAGAELGADVVAIAQSGKGLVRNHGGDDSDPMPPRFELTFAEDLRFRWSFDYEPDVVVVGLGTNDFSQGDPGEAFVRALQAFIAQLRGHYPDAWILLAESPMLLGARHARHAEYLAEAVAAATSAGDTRIATVAIAHQDSADGFGCDYHPSQATARKMATALVAAIRTHLGW